MGSQRSKNIQLPDDLHSNTTSKDKPSSFFRSDKTSTEFTLRPLLDTIQKHNYFQSLRVNKRWLSSRRSRKNPVVEAVQTDIPTPNVITSATITEMMADVKPPVRRLVKSKSHSNVGDVKNFDLNSFKNGFNKRSDANNSSNKGENPDEILKTLQQIQIKSEQNAPFPDQLKKPTESACQAKTDPVCTDSPSNHVDDVDDDKTEEEWDLKNKQNDSLIDDLRTQIDALTQQLKTVGKEDSKIINELSAKIESLARTNNVRVCLVCLKHSVETNLSLI